MHKAISAALLLVVLAACGQSAAPAAGDNSSASNPGVAPTFPVELSQASALETIDACVFTPAEVSAALTGSYAAGIPVAPIPGAPRRDCTYDEQSGMGQLRVNVTWLEPSSAATSRAMMLNMLAGGSAPMAGDPDGAIFQDQTDLGTYALHYSRGNLLYEVRLMAFRGGAAAAREKLLRLRRP
jgi:hypothetical protein